MKLNRLPVLIRTEVTEAAKSASLPAVYSRALQVLEEAVEELSFSKLKTVEISAEGLAAWAKAHQDEKLTKTARELKFRARRTANYIAEKLVAQRRAAFIARGGSPKRGNGGIPASAPESGGVRRVLTDAGYPTGEIRQIQTAARLPDTSESAQMPLVHALAAVRGKGRQKAVRSDLYMSVFRSPHSPFIHMHWIRENRASSLAKTFSSPKEIDKAKQYVTLMHAWCGEFLKNLPRNVSKAKVSK
jgi:hypothetical protein